MQKIDSKQLELLLKRICYDRQIDKKDIAVALDIKPQTLSDYTGGKKKLKTSKAFLIRCLNHILSTGTLPLQFKQGQAYQAL